MPRLSAILLMLTCFAASFDSLAKENKTKSKLQDYKTLIEGSETGKSLEKNFKEFSRKFKNRDRYEATNYKIYSYYLEKIGLKRITDYLHKDDPSCHGAAHALGKVIGEKVSDLKTGMQLCSNTCTYGCVHGIFRVYFTKLGKSYGHQHHGHNTGKTQSAHHKHQHENQPIKLSGKERKLFAKDINSACSESDSVIADFFQGNCAHGVGHAMGQIGKTVKSATQYCHLFPNNEMRYYCETGVFMELEDKIKTKFIPKTNSRSDAIKLTLNYCDKNSNFPSACLRFLLKRNKSLGHITRFATLCARQKEYLRRNCFNALGYFSRTYIAKNPKEFQYVCILGDSKDKYACISGVVHMKKGQRYYPKIKNACKFLADKKQLAFCEKQVNSYYYKLNNITLRTIFK